MSDPTTVNDTTTIDLEEVVRIVNEAGFAAYVEMTGGGVATIYASKRWAEYPGTSNGVPAMFKYPERFGAEDDWHHEVAAGPGWFEGPDYSEPRGNLLDFSVGPDEGAGGSYDQEPSYCGGLDEGGVADLILRYLKGEVAEARRQPAEHVLCDNCGAAASRHGAQAECPDRSGRVFAGEVLA